MSYNFSGEEAFQQVSESLKEGKARLPAKQKSGQYW